MNKLLDKLEDEAFNLIDKGILIEEPPLLWSDEDKIKYYEKQLSIVKVKK